jgi:hypothetical protein
MRLLHDLLYGVETGQFFLREDFLADLPRRLLTKPITGIAGCCDCATTGHAGLF